MRDRLEASTNWVLGRGKMELGADQALGRGSHAVGHGVGHGVVVLGRRGLQWVGEVEQRQRSLGWVCVGVLALLLLLLLLLLKSGKLVELVM